MSTLHLLLLDPRHAGQLEIFRDTGKNPRSPAAVQKPGANAGWRIRPSRGRFSGNQRSHFLSHALRDVGRAVDTARAKWTLTMGAYLTSSDQLSTALRRMTVEQLLQLGTREVVYLKAGTHEDEMPFLLYGADGAALRAFESFEEIVDTVAENGLYLATTH